MTSRVISENPKTIVVVFEIGDEAAGGLLIAAKQHNVAAAQITGIGGFSDVKLGFFDLKKKDYLPIAINEQVEVVSLLGNVALSEQREPKIHVHCTIGKRDGSAHAGHLLQGHVRPTLEVLMIESPQHLHRYHDDNTGLALLKP